MKQEEKQLFKELCKFKADSFDESLLAYASPSVLGTLFFNRMQGVAYVRLKQMGLLGRVNREFRNSLQSAYEVNCQKNESFFQCVSYISELLAEHRDKFAMLKGAILCMRYPQGCRTANDIDLLVLPEYVTLIGNVLLAAGFRQGYIRNGEFLPATRKDIVESKMLRGETVPYIKEVNLPAMQYLEIDLNFSLDYKNSKVGVLQMVLNHKELCVIQNVVIPTLNQEDFFLHLCAHLYKEATTLPWIEMKRDMTLYKYCDLYMLLMELSEEDFLQIFARAKELGIEKICAYAISEAAGLFDLENAQCKKFCEKVLADTPNFLVQVISPKDKGFLRYQTRDVNERFFLDDRVADLKEVSYDA